MHIPDGLLSMPVWLSLDITAGAAVGLVARSAERATATATGTIPRLGMLGAFVFAAQMINFPVAAGTSSHLLGSALLTAALGPASAVIVMTSILAVQALVFQDGGLLALGANVCNMALAGVVAAAAPIRAFGSASRRWRMAGLFAGGTLSAMVAASLLLIELRISGVRMPPAALQISAAVFLLASLIEGAITVTIFTALEKVNPAWTRPTAAAAQERRLGALLLAAAAIVASIGALFASSLPDGLEKLAETLGIAEQARAVLPASPLADYEVQGLANPLLRRALAGLAGIGVIYLVCALVGRRLTTASRHGQGGA